MCGSSVWSLLLALRILRWLQTFCKVCASLSQNVGTSRVAVRLLVSHEDLCHADFITDVWYARQGVPSSVILRHQGRGRVWNQYHTHTRTHRHTHTHTYTRSYTHALTHAHTHTKSCPSQGRSHHCQGEIPADHHGLLFVNTCLGCYHFPFRPTSLVHMQHAYCSFWFVSYEHFPNTL